MFASSDCRHSPPRTLSGRSPPEPGTALHRDDEEDEDSSDSAKRAVPKKSFKLEKEDFPSLHNMKKWHRNDEVRLTNVV